MENIQPVFGAFRHSGGVSRKEQISGLSDQNSILRAKYTKHQDKLSSNPFASEAEKQGRLNYGANGTEVRRLLRRIHQKPGSSQQTSNRSSNFHSRIEENQNEAK